MKYLVFTYGTLMKNRSNHHYVSDDDYRFDAVLNDYILKDTKDDYPAAVPNKGSQIYGEVYEVDEETKIHMDELEEVGELYACNTVKVSRIDNNEIYEVLFYEYLLNTDDMEVFPYPEKWYLR